MSSTRSRRLLVSGRVLLVSAGVLAAGAAWWWLATDSSAQDAAVLEVETAVASLPPATIAPMPAAAPADDTAASTREPTPMPTTAPNPVDTTIPLSPLAELLGERGTAVPPEIEPRVRPMVLGIGEIGVLHPVRAVGLEDNGELEVPDETEIGWYRYGAAPGQPGATVLAAHVTWNRTTGPFLRLGELEPGQRVNLALDDGSQRVYEVVERTMYDKDALPAERIWRTTGPETLVLITCGGDFNPEIRRYRQNIVVYAVPVEQNEIAVS
jgi:hypothetical protein